MEQGGFAMFLQLNTFGFPDRLLPKEFFVHRMLKEYKLLMVFIVFRQQKIYLVVRCPAVSFREIAIATLTKE